MSYREIEVEGFDPQEQLAQMAQRWRARAAIAESIGAGEVSFTIKTDPPGAREMAAMLDDLLAFEARAAGLEDRLAELQAGSPLRSMFRLEPRVVFTALLLVVGVWAVLRVTGLVQ